MVQQHVERIVGQPTQAAIKWLEVAARYTSRPAYIALLQEARKVAGERKASRLGRIHLEIALERLS